MAACIAVAVGVRADICAIAVPKRMLLVWPARNASGVNASEPHDSAVHATSNPSRSASCTRGTSLGCGLAPQ